MARFDVYRVANVQGYLLDCQADVLNILSTRIAVPLLPMEFAPIVARRLNPTFAINGETVVLFPQYMASVGIREIGVRVTSLADQHAAIMNALDMLLIGY